MRKYTTAEAIAILEACRTPEIYSRYWDFLDGMRIELGIEIDREAFMTFWLDPNNSHSSFTCWSSHLSEFVSFKLPLFDFTYDRSNLSFIKSVTLDGYAARVRQIEATHFPEIQRVIDLMGDLNDWTLNEVLGLKPDATAFPEIIEGLELLAKQSSKEVDYNQTFLQNYERLKED